MTAGGTSSDLAFRLAERIRAEPPWEVIGERARRYEVHFRGHEVELERGPLAVEGFGIRVLRRHGEATGTGFQASTDLSPEGLAAAVGDAEAISRHAEFPAPSVELPDDGQSPPEVPLVDPKLWNDPTESLRAYVSALLAPFAGRAGILPTFGSVRATLSEVTIANSSGLRVGFNGTNVDLEVAVKAFGGPEGTPPGEYWVTDEARRLAPERFPAGVDAWCRYAADVRRAKQPPTGELPVILPPDVLEGILPAGLGFRLSGVARLRKLAPTVGTQIGRENISLTDDGTYPWGAGSAPYDDEGLPRRRRTLVEHGKVVGHLYDSLYGAAFKVPSTANAARSAVGPSTDLKFAHAPVPALSTLLLAPGTGGSLAELCEAAGEGILVQQLGWARPDAFTGAFGGEIRIGYRVRGGKIAEPVRGGTVGGTMFAAPGLPSLLASTVEIGNEPSLTGRLVSPAVLVRPLSVAGATA